MVIADASGLPLAVHTDSARPHEVTLVQATLNEIVTMGQPRRIIGDRAYDSDPLDNALAAQGIEMIAPHLHTMFVTPKDVDETVKYLSFTISEGLNMAFEEISE
jgi:hypothetical protein